jgi:hypothetical protein
MSPPNLHTVHMYGGLLALRCEDCGHRVVLEEEKWRDSEGARFIHKGAMKSLDRIKFVCSACKSRNVKWVIPFSWEDAKALLSGQNIKNAGARP